MGNKWRGKRFCPGYSGVKARLDDLHDEVQARREAEPKVNDHQDKLAKRAGKLARRAARAKT